uniref:Uncharacterized protein n=1 Tax=Arundo donax TaxID=35708 RepID=A0A0A9BM30_ARUDO
MPNCSTLHYICRHMINYLEIPTYVLISYDLLGRVDKDFRLTEILMGWWMYFYVLLLLSLAFPMIVQLGKRCVHSANGVGLSV